MVVDCEQSLFCSKIHGKNTTKNATFQCACQYHRRSREPPVAQALVDERSSTDVRGNMVVSMTRTSITNYNIGSNSTYLLLFVPKKFQQENARVMFYNTTLLN